MHAHTHERRQTQTHTANLRNGTAIEIINKWRLYWECEMYGRYGTEWKTINTYIWEIDSCRQSIQFNNEEEPNIQNYLSNEQINKFQWHNANRKHSHKMQAPIFSFVWFWSNTNFLQAFFCCLKSNWNFLPAFKKCQRKVWRERIKKRPQ